MDITSRFGREIPGSSPGEGAVVINNKELRAAPIWDIIGGT